MTPKEIAEDLVNQYRMILMDEDTDCGNEILCSVIAIKNAKIAVDWILHWILQEVQTEILETNFVDNDRYFFWRSVKLELEHL